MKILSIDVGMRNCAYCLLDKDISNNYIIQKWDIIDLCETPNNICQGILKNKKKCTKKANYTKKGNTPAKFYCKTHAKKDTTYKVATNKYLPKYIKKAKIKKLKQLAIEHDISFNKKFKKKDYVDAVLQDISNNYWDVYGKILTKDISMVNYGIVLKKLFLKTFKGIKIDLVLIENQIGPLALRMKTLQGMIIQHFIENNMLNIISISAKNKLKDFLGNKKTNYDERKHTSENITRDLIKNTIWTSHFEAHKKKDDLADSFLQARWYISNKLNN